MIGWNDRRKAKKAASAVTRAQIGAMANRGTLRATTTSPGQREFGRQERKAVQAGVNEEQAKYGPVDNPGITGSRAERWARNTKKVDKASDVNGYDAAAYRKKAAESDARGVQKRRNLPKPKKGM